MALPVQGEATCDCHQRHDVQRDGVGGQIDDDRRGLRHLVGVMDEPVRDHDRVGEARDCSTHKQS